LKRRDLIKKIEAQGGVLIRHGGKHDWYQNPVTKVASRCRDTMKLTNISRGASYESYPNRDSRRIAEKRRGGRFRRTFLAAYG
jgi:hypothetical protein